MARTPGAKALKPQQIASIVGALITQPHSTQQEIAEAHGVCDRTVYEIKASLPDILFGQNSEAIARTREDATVAAIEHLEGFVLGGLRALGKILKKFDDDDWINRQDAQGLASAYATVSERTLFVLGRSGLGQQSAGES